VSADGNYNARNASDVAATPRTTTPRGSRSRPQRLHHGSGGTATFTVVLTSQPTADVTIGLASSDLTEGTVGPASLTFTAATCTWPRRSRSLASMTSWPMAIRLQPPHRGGRERGWQLQRRNASDVAATTTDDDTAGITVSPLSGNATEAGGTATFTVVLTSQPTADVTIGLSSSDLTEGTVGPASLTFTAATWNVAQTVTVTGWMTSWMTGTSPTAS